MIYFLDNSLQLQKIVTSKNIISAIHEHELNGLIRADVELDLSYANKFLILGIDHVGYYYKDEFYLHKIQRVEYDHVNETATVVLRHIFFEDMIFGKLIRDVRPQNQDALTVSRQTIDANTRWQTIMTDVTGRLSTNFYWQVPYEVIEFMTENYRIEYLPKILFDGKKINGFQLHLANKIGEDKNIRIPYGSRVLDLKYEEDYSEIITKLVVHGKGEEVGDGYGRRINISDVNFSRNGVKSPVGSLYLEDESITNTYGNDGQTPREGREVFEDIEDANELAEAGYQHYLQVSRPQMLFTADVSDIGDVGIGDSVMIIRREYDVYFNARIHKLSVDLLYPEDAQVELGDYEHFKESKIARKTREKNNQYRRETSSRIQQLKEQFNDRFDGEVNQMWEDFEQALIDAHAEIAAAEVRMTEVIDTERNQMMEDYNTKVEDAREHAEQQAQEKANAVRTELETVTSGHQSMLDDLESNVMNIDDFLGDISSITLDERLQDINRNFEERIRNVDSNTYNMLRGTRFDESGMWDSQSTVVLMDDEDINYYRLGLGSSNAPYIRYMRESTFEADEHYILSVDYRTEEIPELDFVAVQTSEGDIYLNDLSEDNTVYELIMDGQWTRLIVRFTPSETITGQLFIGTHFNLGDTTRGVIDIRLPYITSSNNTQWVYHPLDATQSIEEVTRRITNLEDGRNELITRTEWDSESDYIMQMVRDIEETVDTSRSLIQEIENYEIIQRGSEAIQTVDGFLDKVWLNDFAEIGANLIPQSSNAWENGTFWSSGTNNNNSGGIRTKDYIEVIPGEQYTFQDESAYVSSILEVQIAEWDGDTRIGITAYVKRGSSHSFTAQGDRIRIGLTPIEGFGIAPWFVDHLDERIKMKLEKGNSATPFMNALSRVEQLADSFSVQVAELDGTYLKQSELEITPEYAQIGSMRIDGDTVGSMLRVSPDGIDAIASAMRLSGDLYVDGDITTIAVDAIEGNFARLWADEFSAITIDVDDIQGFTARFEYLYTLNANIEKLVSQRAFINEINTLSLNAVYGNISDLRTELLTAGVISAKHLNVNYAMIDELFAYEGRIGRLTSKLAFIRDIQAIEITANQLNLTTLRNRFNQIEGGLHIRRTDHYVENGVEYGMYIQNGIPNMDVDVQRNRFMHSDIVTHTGQRYQMSGSNMTNNRLYNMETIYTSHKSKYITVGFGLNISGTSGATVFFELAEFGSGNALSRRNIYVTSGDTNWNNTTINLGVPDYNSPKSFYLRAGLEQTYNSTYLQVIINRVNMHG